MDLLITKECIQQSYVQRCSFVYRLPGVGSTGSAFCPVFPKKKCDCTHLIWPSHGNCEKVTMERMGPA